MKRLIRSFAYYFLGFHLAVSYLAGIQVQDGLSTLLTAALAMTFFNLLVKPILKLLFLPINLLTLGMFRWLINVIILYLLMLAVPHFKIVGFEFAGLTYQRLVLPQMTVSPFLNVVLVSFFLSFVWTILTKIR